MLGYTGEVEEMLNTEMHDGLIKKGARHTALIVPSSQMTSTLNQEGLFMAEQVYVRGLEQSPVMPDVSEISASRKICSP